ncbi:SDR family oxidoreductase [Actinomadura sp. SCN-SB]|uniref:SDR family oxidoreductase n=1 Tax=Actinomadura sp. SCN-SB TaxID=3373092 RepID=UPI00375069D3
MTTPSRDLQGKVAVVVGGSRNMGAAIAEEIASRGATTVISYAAHEDDAKATVATLEGHGVTAEAVRSDATEPGATDRLLTDVIERHGHVDIVVHMPGMVLKKPIADITDAEYDEVVGRNTRTAFWTLRAASRHLADGGRCVLLSTTITRMTVGLYGLYAGSKAAVEQLVKAAAQELGGRRITVNAVAPGPIDDSFFHSAETPESVAWVMHANPFNRLGLPGDVAPVVGFLVSDAAGWVTGQVLPINGGMV